MFPDSENRPQTITTGAYSGPVTNQAHNRNIFQCEKLWRSNGYPFQYDSLMTRQLQLAYESGRDEVIHLDLGSGDAGLFRHFLNSVVPVRQTRLFLQQHPHMRIRLIGLTDAGNPDQMLAQQPLNPDPELPPEAAGTNPLVDAVNTFYTLTASQRLQHFLKSLNLENSLDLVTATSSLQYLGATNFRRVIEDTISNFRGPGSFMLGSSFSSLYPGMVLDQGQPVLRIPATNTAPVPALLRDKGKRLISRADFQSEIGNFIAAMAMFSRLGISSDCDIAADELQKLAQTSVPFRHRPVAQAITSALREAEQKLLNTRMSYFRRIKSLVLDELKDEHSETVTLDYKLTNLGGGFIITRLAS